MRTVRVNLPLAVMLGLAGSSTAFLQSVRPTNFVVPSHKYNAAVSRTRAVQPRAAAAARNMRIMSAAVDETEATEVSASDTADEATAVEIPVATEDALEVRSKEGQKKAERDTRSERLKGELCCQGEARGEGSCSGRVCVLDVCW